MAKREKDRKLKRSKRRRKKLRMLKAKLAQAKDLKAREHLISKITRITIYPYKEE